MPWYEFNYRKKFERFRDTKQINILPAEERRIAKKLGLQVIEIRPSKDIIVVARVPLDRYFLVKDGDEIGAEIRQLTYDKEPDNIRKIGTILGYPKCCIEEFVENNVHFLTPDLRMQEQLKFWKEKQKPINPLSFYAGGFLPCKPDCERAAEIGRKMLDKYKELDMTLFDGYGDFLHENVERIQNEDLARLQQVMAGL